MEEDDDDDDDESSNSADTVPLSVQGALCVALFGSHYCCVRM